MALLLAAACGDVQNTPPGADGGTGGGDGGGDGDGDGSDPDGGGVGPVAKTCQEASGSRLRWRVRPVGGDVQEYVELVDTEHDLVCSFAKAPDGIIRCLPRQSSPVAFGYVTYRNDTCTDKIIDLRGAADSQIAAVPEYIADGPCGGGDRYHFWRLGASLGNLAGQTLYYPEGESCNPYPVFGESFLYFDVADSDEYPTDSFVEATPEQSATGRVTVTELVGSDGTRQCEEQRPYRDAELDQDCTVEPAEDGTRRCLPVSGYADTLYTDEQCTDDVPVVSYQLEECLTTRFVTEPVTGGCGETRRVRPYGEPIVNRELFQGGPGGFCFPWTPSPDVTYRGLGARTQPETFAAMTRECLPAGDRLEACVHASEDGLRVIERRYGGSPGASGNLPIWRDTRHGALCQFRTSADSMERCLPIHDPEAPVAEVRTVYPTASCAEGQAIQAAVIDTVCSEAAPTLAVDGPSAVPTRVFELGALQRGPFYLSQGTCGPAPIGLAVYQLGDQIQPEMFVPVRPIELE